MLRRTSPPSSIANSTPGPERSRCWARFLGAAQPDSERPRLDISVVDVTKSEPTKVLDRDGIVVTAQGIPHSMPTLAYRIETNNRSVVFSSDQNGTDPKFVDFAKGADVLVMHMNLPPALTQSVPRHACRARTRRAGRRSEAADRQPHWPLQTSTPPSPS